MQVIVEEEQEVALLYSEGKSPTVNRLLIPARLDRKRSISLIELPNQNRNFLCVPPDIDNLNYVQRGFTLKPVPPCIPTYQLHKLQSLESMSQKSFESLKRIVSTTSLQVPENFSFASLEIQVYKVRWLLLVLVQLLIVLSYIQWIQYSIIANIMTRYYRVEPRIIDWTSMVFMVTYILLVFPISYLMDNKVGLE